MYNENNSNDTKWDGFSDPSTSYLGEILKKDGFNFNPNNFKIKIGFINKSDNKDPIYEHEGDSGFDIRANLKGIIGLESVRLKPLERKLIPTGLYFELPESYELQVRPRSGLALNHGITVLNTPATIDQAYVGEVKVILINLGSEDFVINHGDRIAQGVVSPRLSTEMGYLISVDKIDPTSRNDGGFGSTGVK